MNGDAGMFVDTDVSCGKCGYNVRTLAVTARCPECGFPVLRSYVSFHAGVRGFVAPDSARLLRTTFLVLARILRRNVDAVRFVFAAYQHAQRSVANDPGRYLADPEAHAADLCRSVVDHALEHYGSREDAMATFKFWRIERSEDVGEIVAGLVEAGLMVPGKNDSPDDFVGHCDFITILSSR